MKTIDLSQHSVRELNQVLHDQAGDCSEREWMVLRPAGKHAIACGLDAEIQVDVQGHAGYDCAGMNQRASVTMRGNAGQGVAENMMSGTVRVAANASQSAAATAHGRLLVVSNAAVRPGAGSQRRKLICAGCT